MLPAGAGRARRSGRWRRAVPLVATPFALLVAFRDAAAIRPFDGTDAAVADAGTIELEVGPVDWIDTHGDDVLAPTAVLNVGFAQGWELSAYAQPSWRISEGSGRRFALVDDGVVLKRILRDGSLQGRAGPSVAVEVSALLPATDPLDRFGARVTPVVSQTWKGFTGHLGASVSWTRLNQPAVNGSLILEGPEIAARLHPAIEVTTGWERDLGSSWSGLAALLWSPRDDLDLDLGLRIGRAFGTNVRELRAGFTWRFHAWDAAGPDRVQRSPSEQ